jgi:threonyl-tRNA synthetase
MNNLNREQVIFNIKSKHIVLLPSGEELKIDISKPEKIKSQLEPLGYKELESYILGEEVGRKIKNKPPSINEMRRLQLVDYESASDSGHFRFYPKGVLISELLKKWADDIALRQLNAMQIESPLIYDWSDPDIQEQGKSFHENHYKVSVGDNKDKHFVLRFAGDFGLFKIMSQAKFSHKMLPLRIYELSKSFRYEKRGALSGLKRLRAFHIPDIHCFCKNLNQGWEEHKLLYKKYSEYADNVGIPYAVCFRVVEDFYNEHKSKILDLVKYSNKPVYIELLSDMKHYWIVKHEFQGMDSVGGSVQLATVQLDIKDSDIYNIKYADSDGKDNGCIICHSSIGSIERWIYCILENAIMLKKPVLPVWLSPCQLRVIPVSDKHVEFCESIDFKNIRFEIDDRNESIGKKILDANKNWIPYIAVIGDNEIQSNSMMVSSRFNDKKQKMPMLEIEQLINSECGNKPFISQSMPKLLSKHPIFYG